MKKALIIGGILLICVVVIVGIEFLGNRQEVKGEYVVDFTCESGCEGIYSHTMSLEDIDLIEVATGSFSGTGHNNTDSSYTWDITGEKKDDITVIFDIVYTGVNAGYSVTLTGTINQDGTITGTATSSDNETFTWTATLSQDDDEGEEEEEEEEEEDDGKGVERVGDYDSHGAYVSSAEDKREAAHSRMGMPVQSKGHLDKEEKAESQNKNKDDDEDESSNNSDDDEDDDDDEEDEEDED